MFNFLFLLTVVSCLKVSIKIPGQEVLTLNSPQKLQEEISFAKATLSFKEIPDFATEILVQVGDKTYAVKDKKVEIKGSDFTDVKDTGITVFVSSRSSKEHLKYPLGNVKLLQTAKASLETDSFHKLPEISHIFEKPRPKDSSFRALVFSGLLGGVWIPFIYFLNSKGANVSNLFVNSKVRGWGQVFILALVANIVLLGLYWTVLNLFQFLPLAAVLGLATVLVGRNALKARYDWRNQ